MPCSKNTAGNTICLLAWVVMVLCREVGDTGPNSLMLKKIWRYEGDSVIEQERSDENLDLYVQFTVLEMNALYGYENLSFLSFQTCLFSLLTTCFAFQVHLPSLSHQQHRKTVVLHRVCLEAWLVKNNQSRFLQLNWLGNLHCSCHCLFHLQNCAVLLYHLHHYESLLHSQGRERWVTAVCFTVVL